MTMMPPAILTTDASDTRSHTDASSTWRDLAGLWLQRNGAAADDSEKEARRLAALRRWRGLSSQTLSNEA